MRLFGTDGIRTFDLVERFFDGKDYHIIETLTVYFTFTDDCRDSRYKTDTVYEYSYTYGISYSEDMVAHMTIEDTRPSFMTYQCG